MADLRKVLVLLKAGSAHNAALLNEKAAPTLLTRRPQVVPVQGNRPAAQGLTARPEYPAVRPDPRGPPRVLAAAAERALRPGPAAAPPAVSSSENTRECAHSLARAVRPARVRASPPSCSSAWPHAPVSVIDPGLTGNSNHL